MPQIAVECLHLVHIWYFLRAWTFCKRDQKSIQMSLDTRTLLTTEPTTCYLLQAGLYLFIYFLLPELSRKYGFQSFSCQPPHLRYAAAETRSRLARRRRSAAFFRDCAVLPGAPVSPSGSPKVPLPLRPGLRVAGVPSRSPLQPLSRPSQARSLPSDPALHNARSKSPGVWTPASLPLGGDRRRPRGEPRRRAQPVQSTGPGPASSPRAAAADPRAARARCPPLPSQAPPPQPWRKFIDVSMPGLKEKPPRNPPHTDMRRSWGWRRPKRWPYSWSCWPPAFTAWALSWSWWSTRACSPTTGRAEAAAAQAAERKGKERAAAAAGRRHPGLWLQSWSWTKLGGSRRGRAGGWHAARAAEPACTAARSGGPAPSAELGTAGRAFGKLLPCPQCSALEMPLFRATKRSCFVTLRLLCMPDWEPERDARPSPQPGPGSGASGFPEFADSLWGPTRPQAHLKLWCCHWDPLAEAPF